MRTSYAALTALLLAIATNPPANAADSPGLTPIRVGFVCPLTGGSRDMGNSARLGAELAVEEINQFGGYLGRRVELVERDDHADPERGRRAAEDLVVNQKVAFTVGYCNSGVALKSLDLFQSHRSVLVVPVATNSRITSTFRPADSFVFRMAAGDGLQSHLIVDDLLKRGLTRVAVFADRTDYGEGGLRDVVRLLRERGLQPAYVARFDIGVKALVDEMKDARAAGADAIVSYTVGPEQAVIARARAQAHFGGPQYGPWPLSWRSVEEAAGPALEGAVTVQTVIQDPANERTTAFVSGLSRRAGGEAVGSLMAAAQAYDAVHLMMRAVFQTHGDTSGVALKYALEHLEHPYHGVITLYDKPFSPDDHDAFSLNMIWLGVWHGGEVQFLHPEDAKRSVVARHKESTR